MLDKLLRKMFPEDHCFEGFKNFLTGLSMFCVSFWLTGRALYDTSGALAAKIGLTIICALMFLMMVDGYYDARDVGDDFENNENVR